MSNTRILPLFGGGGPDPSDFYTKEQIDAMLLDYAQLATSDLVNYYLKSETLTTSEIEALVGQITSFEVVATLPVSDIKTNVIYLLGPTGSGADRYEEWIYSNSTWVKIGETSVDLSNYITVNQLNTALGFYTTTQQLNTLLAAKQDTLTAGDGITIGTDGTISAESNVVSLTQAQYDALAEKDPDIVYIITDATPVTLATVATTGAYSDLTGTPTLATVATSGSYNDLTDKPTIPVVPTLATVATTGDYEDLTNKPVIPVVPTLATVATSGSYNDLTDKPTIPTVGTGVVTLTQGGATIGTFGLNDSDDKTIEIPAGGGGSTEEIEQAIAAAINDTRDTINQDLHNNYVQTQTMNDQLKNYAPKTALDAYSSKAYVDTAIGSVYAEIEDKERATSFALNDLEAGKQDILTAGAGITIGTDGTISAIGTGTVALTFTLDGIGTVTYNVVIN